MIDQSFGKFISIYRTECRRITIAITNGSCVFGFLLHSDILGNWIFLETMCDTRLLCCFRFDAESIQHLCGLIADDLSTTLTERRRPLPTQYNSSLYNIALLGKHSLWELEILYIIPLTHKFDGFSVNSTTSLNYLESSLYRLHPHRPTCHASF